MGNIGDQFLQIGSLPFCAFVWLGLLFILLMFTCAALFVAFLRRKLVLFSDRLCETIDNMLDGASAPPQVYEEAAARVS